MRAVVQTGLARFPGQRGLPAAVAVPETRMNDIARDWRRARQWVWPLTAVLAVVLAFGWSRDLASAVAALFGGAMAAVNAGLLYWHLRRAERLAGDSVPRNAQILYRCAAERFAATVLLFALGIGILKLAPLALLSGFIVGQIAWAHGGFLNRN